jgi:hypothetical protein
LCDATKFILELYYSSKLLLLVALQECVMKNIIVTISVALKTFYPKHDGVLYNEEKIQHHKTRAISVL